MASTLRILVVDDELVMRELLRTFLAGHGHLVSTAEDANEAAQAIEAGHFDLVITDLQLGEASGLEVIQMVKAMSTSTEVFMMTGCHETHHAIAAFRYGASAYFFKPFSFNDLLRRLGSVTGTTYSVSRSLTGKTGFTALTHCQDC